MINFMPQMKPMNWIILASLAMVISFILMVKLYYLYEKISDFIKKFKKKS